MINEGHNKRRVLQICFLQIDVIYLIQSLGLLSPSPFQTSEKYLLSRANVYHQNIVNVYQ